MGRKPKPWPRKGRSGWWTKVGGKFVKLGETEREAWVELDRLLGAPTADARITVMRLVDLWFDAIRRQVKPITADLYRTYAQSLIARLGRMAARDVREHHVDSWLDAHPNWNGCRPLAMAIARMPFRWGKRKGYLESNPLSEMRGRSSVARKPPPDGAVAALPEGFHSEEFADLFALMCAIGCRPGEARTLEADRIDLANRVAVVEGKKGVRVVPLPEAAIGPLGRALARHPEGYVFRNTRGEPWTAGALSEQVRRARTRLGIEGVVAYHARGDFATRAHAAGVDGVTIAAILGHKDTSRLAVLIKHYLRVSPEVLRRAAESASAAPPPAAPEGPEPGAAPRPDTTPRRRRGPRGGS